MVVYEPNMDAGGPARCLKKLSVVRFILAECGTVGSHRGHIHDIVYIFWVRVVLRLPPFFLVRGGVTQVGPNIEIEVTGCGWSRI